MSTEQNVSPAAELRAAASKIREIALRAEAGPWMADGSEIYGPHVGIWVGETLNQDDATMTAANSAHIALWHPGIAMLVCDWLIGTAAIAEAGFRQPSQQALDLARAINGGRS